MAGMFKKVIIVGAGPAGLLLALFLAQEGIEVQVLEAAPKIDDQPRATHYGPAAVHELRRAGVLDAIQAEGFCPEGVCWRKLDGSIITDMPQAPIPSADRVTSLPVNRVANIILEAVYRQPTASISFSHKVTEIGQDAEKAWVSVQTSTGVQIFDADYIVGADGASSTLRHSLFNNNFPGYTWAPWLVATNVYYDFDTIGWHDINFIVHPEHWFMAARISKGGLWRVTYSEPGHLSPQEVIERQAEKFRTMLPDQPTPDQYKLVNISPYRIHQRCAERFRSGRFLLVADAAHLCNPMGGMGLTSGVVDVGGLYDCLAGIYHNLANESILDKYDEVRRGIYHDVIDKISTVNLQRLMMEEPDRALELDPFLKTCNEARTDPKELAKFAGIMRASAGLKHDFTQYYRTAG